MKIETVIDSDLIDEYGHVNYKKYLGLFEQGQDAFVNERDLGFDSIHKRFGIKSVVRAIKIDYLTEIILGEKVTIETTVKVGTSSVIFMQTISKDGVLCTKCELVVVMLDSLNKKWEISPEFKDKLSG